MHLVTRGVDPELRLISYGQLPAQYGDRFVALGPSLVWANVPISYSYGVEIAGVM